MEKSQNSLQVLFSQTCDGVCFYQTSDTGKLALQKKRYFSATFQIVGNLWKCDLAQPHNFTNLSNQLKATEM